ncbi:ATP-binding protein [Streptomyces sp. NPDC056405]|uniref:ATP-binding protein n=1 Tax=Streptomyces sp. NPDC056405 TaxID=3345811 RepID=UPI0035E28CCA
MRRIAAARLRYCGLESMTDDVMLIVSELLTNALQHSGAAEISLAITVDDEALRVRVRDGMPITGAARSPEECAESGRGLLLVDALAKERSGAWGFGDAGAEPGAVCLFPGWGSDDRVSRPVVDAAAGVVRAGRRAGQASAVDTVRR